MTSHCISAGALPLRARRWQAEKRQIASRSAVASEAAE